MAANKNKEGLADLAFLGGSSGAAMVRVLVAATAPVDARNVVGETPLLCAARAAAAILSEVLFI